MKKLPLQSLIEASIFAAFAVVLDLLPSIKLTPAISISIAMLPIFLVAMRWGIKAGMLSGFIWGLLQIILGDAYILTPVQAFLEYFVAFAFIGLAGVCMPAIRKSWSSGNKLKGAAYVMLAVLAGSFARYFWHFLAGYYFFGEYAPEGMSPFYYSFAVNGVTMIGSFILCGVALMLLLSVAPRLLTTGVPSSMNKTIYEK